ncbi:flagellar protein FliT [Paenibacillus popilliae]|uniref:GMP synthase n=1 Tax=Paenibacillus popilliae ATCC 14706 TaxID=1212764 RepID=M9M2F7_PAEPP|nr:flagellar protein FliT [Paenibacillus popilliae]GAC41328.1 GMP synthase [Paenibacillus popilliae ATCC 14706]
MHKIRTRMDIYDEMIDICEQYLLEVKNSEWQESTFFNFSVKWDRLKELIPSNEIGARSDKEREQEVIRCQTLMNLYQSIMDQMEIQLSRLGSEMKGARQSKRIINAYQGMGRIDQIAFYFDEKK